MNYFDSSIAILELTKTGTIQWQNEFFGKTFRYLKQETIAKNLSDFFQFEENYADQHADLLTHFSSLSHSDDEHLLSGLFLHRYYYQTPVKLHLQLDDVNPNVIIARFMVVQNIGYDNIIGMPNGWAVSSMCHHYFKNEKVTGKNLGYIMFDVDSFASINYRYGYGIGDRFLCKTGEKLQGLVGETNLVVRLSNSRFSACISNPANLSVAEFHQYMLVIASKICQQFKTPTKVNNELEIQKNYSIGVCPNASMYSSYCEMDTATEKAMLMAKRIGETTFKVAKLEYASQLNEIRTIIDLLPRAIEHDEFAINYQPQYSLDGSQLIGLEALSRWSIPECGAISPLIFVQYAENLGLFVEFDMNVLQKVCHQVTVWHAQNIRVPIIAVNMSLKTLESPTLVEKVRQILEQTECSAEHLEIEITETSNFSRFDTVLDNITELYRMGIVFSLDDFGTGYSSLWLLGKLAFALSKIKLDIDLTKKVSGPDADLPFVKQIIGFKEVLDVKVLAEGVETKEQKNSLMRMNCDYAQGYFYSKPLTLVDTTACLISASVLKRPFQLV